jgi:hypothetical protein
LLGVVIALSMGVTGPVWKGIQTLSRYPPIRFAWCYMLKRRQKIHRPSKLRLRHLREKTRNQTMDIGLANLLHSNDEADISTRSYRTNIPQQASPLLLKHPGYNVLQMIACKLHYVDIINLSLVSRRIHQVIFSDSRLAE